MSTVNNILNRGRYEVGLFLGYQESLQDLEFEDAKAIILKQEQYRAIRFGLASLASLASMIDVLVTGIFLCNPMLVFLATVSTIIAGGMVSSCHSVYAQYRNSAQWADVSDMLILRLKIKLVGLKAIRDNMPILGHLSRNQVEVTQRSISRLEQLHVT